MVIGETGDPRSGEEGVRRRRATSGRRGPVLHRLFQRAFRVAKQVRTHTEITRGAVSVGSVAVDLAVKIFGELRNAQGARARRGRNERTDGARSGFPRRDRSAGDQPLAANGRSIWRRWSAAARSAFDGWENQCREIDILISSTAADEPLLTREKLAPILRDRWDRPLFIIDIAVPRDVAPEVNEMEGVFLYDIDSLQSIAEQSLALRRQQIVAGEEIIARTRGRFWRLAASPRAASACSLRATARVRKCDRPRR